MSFEKARIIVLLSAAISIGAVAASSRSYCYGDGHCESAAPLPIVRERHLIHISPNGTCKLDGTETLCSKLGAHLKKAYPGSNPQIGLCPDALAPFARIGSILHSLGKAHFLCIDFDCNADSTSLASQCQDL